MFVTILLFNKYKYKNEIQGIFFLFTRISVKKKKNYKRHVYRLKTKDKKWLKKLGISLQRLVWIEIVMENFTDTTLSVFWIYPCLPLLTNVSPNHRTHSIFGVCAHLSRCCEHIVCFDIEFKRLFGFVVGFCSWKKIMDKKLFKLRPPFWFKV